MMCEVKPHDLPRDHAVHARYQSEHENELSTSRTEHRYRLKVDQHYWIINLTGTNKMLFLEKHES